MSYLVITLSLGTSMPVTCVPDLCHHIVVSHAHYFLVVEVSNQCTQCLDSGNYGESLITSQTSQFFTGHLCLTQLLVCFHISPHKWLGKLLERPFDTFYKVVLLLTHSCTSSCQLNATSGYFTVVIGNEADCYC